MHHSGAVRDVEKFLTCFVASARLFCGERLHVARERRTHMRTTIIAIVLVLLGLTVADRGHAQGRFGAGFMFGEPTGISWKYRINQSNAVDGGIGFSPFDRYRIHADYLWQSTPFREPQLALY